MALKRRFSTSWPVVGSVFIVDLCWGCDIIRQMFIKATTSGDIKIANFVVVEELDVRTCRNLTNIGKVYPNQSFSNISYICQIG